MLALGAWHGLNPAMGWPLAVANALAEKRGRALLATMLPLGFGHLLAMALVLLPFALLAGLFEWQRPIRLAAGALVLAFGLWRWFDRRHPRALARIAPSRLVAWSFLMASAHGAALMLLPFALGLCSAAAGGPADALMRAAPAVALVVALAHTLAMLAAGYAMAWSVYRVLGLEALRRSWLRLDAAWAASLVLTGGVALALALRG